MSSDKLKEYRQPRFQRPDGATEILLVRHGESEAAMPGVSFPLIDGQGDPALAPAGQRQAQAVCERLKHLPISAIYTSNLTRTQQTAAPLCENLALSPVVNADLREVHLGEWEGGLFRIKAQENDPVYQKMREQQRWDVIPGAEKLLDFNHRIMGALQKIAADHQDQLVVAVVHGGVIGQIIASASGANAFAFNGADNGSISHIVVDKAQLSVRSFNDYSHLPTE